METGSRIIGPNENPKSHHYIIILIIFVVLAVIISAFFALSGGSSADIVQQTEGPPQLPGDNEFVEQSSPAPEEGGGIPIFPGLP